MNTLRKALLISLLGASSIAYADTVINFDDLSGSGQVATSYQGLTWSNGWNYYDAAQSPYDPSSGAERVYVYDNAQTISFGQAVTFEGSFFSGYDSSAPSWVGYDQFNNVIFTSAPGLGTQNLNWSGVWSVGLVSSAPDYFIVDDIKFDSASTNSVPDASTTLELVGLGMVGLGMVRRKLA